MTRLDSMANGGQKILLLFIGAQLAIVLGLLGELFHAVLFALASDWFTSVDDSYGIILMLAGFYFLFEKRQLFNRSNLHFWFPGLSIFLSGLLLYLAGLLAVEYYSQRISFFIVCWGIGLYIGGPAVLKVSRLSIVLFLLAVPLPAIIVNAVTLPLKLTATAFAAETLQLLNIPVFQNGNILELTNINLEVVNACSGIRSILALFVLVIILSINVRSAIAKGILILSTFPVAIFTNAMRITSTGIISYWGYSRIARKFYHSFSGWLLFIVSISLILLIKYLLKTAFGDKNRLTHDG